MYGFKSSVVGVAPSPIFSSLQAKGRFQPRPKSVSGVNCFAFANAMVIVPDFVDFGIIGSQTTKTSFFYSGPLGGAITAIDKKNLTENENIDLIPPIQLNQNVFRTVKITANAEGLAVVNGSFVFVKDGIETISLTITLTRAVIFTPRTAKKSEYTLIHNFPATTKIVFSGKRINIRTSKFEEFKIRVEGIFREADADILENHFRSNPETPILFPVPIEIFNMENGVITVPSDKAFFAKRTKIFAIVDTLLNLKTVLQLKEKTIDGENLILKLEPEMSAPLVAPVFPMVIEKLERKALGAYSEIDFTLRVYPVYPL